MKKRTSAKIARVDDDPMRPEYDFTGGVRGKYAKALREHGYSIRVYNSDGTFTEKQVAGEKTVTLDPDVHPYFPNSKSVNRALRGLIALLPTGRRRVAAGRTRPHKAHDHKTTAKRR